MLNLLDVIFEYQSLRTAMDRVDAHDGGRAALDDVDSARLIGLGRLLAKKARARLPQPVPAQLTVPGGFGGGEIHSLSRNGVAMTSTHVLERGTRTILRIADPTAGVEYVFPAKIASCRGRVLGVAFDGPPSKTPYITARVDASWHRDVRFGGVRFGGVATAETLVA